MGEASFLLSHSQFARRKEVENAPDAKIAEGPQID
jgi:hypothetical protein